MDTLFPTHTTDLPEATRPQLLELADGDELQLRCGPVVKRLGDSTVRMLGYNGSIPGPTLKVRQGSEVVVHARNDTDLDTTVHWHGLRLQNRFDGVPHETQAPIPPGGEFTYRIEFPDPGLYWYHPHIREDVTQELGLYGCILVDPAEPDYWPPAHRDVVLTLDDLLLEDGVVPPFSRTETNYAAMGRYGNLMLTGGETAPAFTAKSGEVVRLWLTNTANSRVFRVGVPGARMKLVGGDAGRTVQFDDGTSRQVDVVVWATGYRPDHTWIDVPGVVRDGRVAHSRGVTDVPGLYFLGLSWQHTRGSALLGFVADDAAHVTRAAAISSAQVPAPRGAPDEPAVLRHVQD